MPGSSADDAPEYVVGGVALRHGVLVLYNLAG